MNTFSPTKLNLDNYRKLIQDCFDPELNLKDNCDKIKKIQHIDIGTLSLNLKKMGLRVKEGRGEKPRLQKNPFEIGSVDNEYWLGFLIADGHVGKEVGKSGCYLFNNQIEFLRTFYVHCGVILSERIRIYNEDKKRLIISFGHIPTHSYLHSLGISSDKRYGFPLKFKLTYPMIRGIFDGDGSCRFRNYNLEWKITTGSPFLIKALQEFLNDQGFRHSTKMKGNAHDFFLLGSKLDKMRFFDKLYEKGDFHLPYKLEKMKHLISTPIVDRCERNWKSNMKKLAKLL